jgi:hypothetical protein
MITPPPTAEPPQPGPLAAPSEDELVAAYRELRDQALTVPWAAVALGLEPARLEALARAGELLVVPGPWPMRQAHASGLGYFLPAWQLAAGGHVPHEALPALFAAAAERGWTSLDLHRFMTTPLTPAGPSPAELLRQGAVARVVALARGGPDPEPPAPEPRKRHRWALRTPLHREVPA